MADAYPLYWPEHWPRTPAHKRMPSKFKPGGLREAPGQGRAVASRRSYRGGTGMAGVIRRFDTWSDHTARLFACDCAERVLHLYESKYPDDIRVRNCIEVARKVANGDLPVEELAAARDAARDAAWAAAAAAARDAEREWQTGRLFDYLEGRTP